MKKPTYDPVTVTWIDSARYGGWHGPGSEDYKPSLCKTRGFLLQSTRKIVSLATSLGLLEDGKIGEVCDVMVIPRSCVKSIRKDRGSRHN